MGLLNLEKNKVGIVTFYKILNSAYGFILNTTLIITTLIWMFEYLIDYSKQEIANRMIRYCVQSLPIVILLNIGCALFIFAFLFFKGMYKTLKPVPAPVFNKPDVVVKEIITKPEPVVVKEPKEPKESVTFVLAEGESTEEPSVIQMENMEIV